MECLLGSSFKPHLGIYRTSTVDIMSETSAHTELLKAGQVTADHIMKNGASVEAGSSYTLLRDCKASAR